MPPDRVLEPLFISTTAHVFAFVLGALWGSFANVCIYRWPPTDDHPDGRSVVRPGSHCGACGRDVRWYDNIPIVSWLVLRGRCRHCKAEFSARYLLVEIMVAILFVAIYQFVFVLAFPHEPLSARSLRFVAMAAFALAMVVIAFIDLDHLLILDKITYPAIPVFYALGALLPGRGFTSGLVGAVLGYGVVWAIVMVYKLVTGRVGMGFGDAKLLAVVGAFMGWQAVVASLFIGSLAGSLVGIPLVLARRHRTADAHDDTDADAQLADAHVADAHDADADAVIEDAEADVSLRHEQLPFGPFLALGALVYAFLEPIIEIRLSLP